MNTTTIIIGYPSDLCKPEPLQAGSLNALKEAQGIQRVTPYVATEAKLEKPLSSIKKKNQREKKGLLR